MTDRSGAVLRYRIDAADRIVAVSDNWLAFARRNGAPQLTPDAVLGRSLWGFVADRETVDLSRMIFDRVRAGTSEAVLPFRCNSPRIRRDLEMSLRPTDGHELEICTSVVREHAGGYVALLDPGAPRSDDIVKACSWCNRIELPEQGWVEVDAAVRQLGLFAGPLTPRVSHGICPDCVARTRAALERTDDPAPL